MRIHAFCTVKTIHAISYIAYISLLYNTAHRYIYDLSINKYNKRYYVNAHL